MAFERPQRGLGAGSSAPRFQPRGSVVGSPPVPTGIRGRGFRPQTAAPSPVSRPPGTLGFGPPTAQQLPEQAFQLFSPQYNRPKSPLDVILRVLQVPENVVAGFAEGVAGGLDDGDLPPWAYLKALGLGFVEIPSAMRHGQTFHELLQERTDPNSFWHKNANVVGLGMSIFFDPTMYLTFGATGASRIAAKGVLATTARQTSEEVNRYMANGVVHAATGRKYGPKDDWDEVFAEIHAASGRPFTMGDALSLVKTTDRSGEAGLYRRAFARGGRGVRFMGKEIPGTVGAGQGIANIFRQSTNEVLSMKSTPSFLARAFIPDAKLKAVTNDMLRSLALARFREVDNEAAKLGRKLTEQAADIAKLKNPVSRQVAGIFGKPVEYVSQAERRNALVTKGAQTPAVHDMVQAAHLRKATMISQAKRQGMSAKQMESIEDLWQSLLKRHPDPVQVVAHFTAQVGSRLLAHRQIENLLRDPLIARRVDPDLTVAKEGNVVRSLEDAAQITRQKTRPFRYNGKTYAVSDAVGEALENIKNPAFVDHEVMRVLNSPIMNGLQNLWKIPATVLNPAFHLMNNVGAMWNNMLAGPYGPMDHHEAWARIVQKRIAEGESRALGPTLLALTKPLRKGRNVDPNDSRRLYQEAEDRGIWGGFISAELSSDLATRTAKGAGDRPLLPKFGAKRLGGVPVGIKFKGGDMGRIFTAGRRTVAAAGALEAATDVAAYEGWIDDIDVPYVNPLMGLVAGLPEIARAGRFASAYTEEVARMTPFQEAWKDRGLRQVMEAVGPITPANFAKTAPKGLTKKKEKALFDIGAEMALHFQFDYTRLTPAERMFAKTVFPFWVYYKNNFLLQAAEVAQRPRFVQGFYHMANYIEEEFGEEISPEMEKMLPEYFSDLGAFQLPVPSFAREFLGLPQDTPLFLNPKIPFVSLNLFPPFWELFNHSSQTPFSQRLLQVASPITGSVGPFAPIGVPGAKLIFESMTGMNLGLAKPIDYQRASSNDWRQSFTPAPGYFKYLPKSIAEWFGAIQNPGTGELIMPATYKYIVDTMSSPFISNYGKVISSSYTGARRDKQRADLVAWTVGLRLMPVDPVKISRAWSYRMESSLEAKRAELREQGMELEPEDEQLLRQTRELIKQVEAIWDQRERELFGG